MSELEMKIKVELLRDIIFYKRTKAEIQAKYEYLLNELNKSTLK
jgi:hypothetical protein